MNGKQLQLLIGAAVVLGLIYIGISSSGDSANSTQRRELLSGIPSARVSKLLLAQGEEQVELAVQNGQWTVPSRNNFSADASKVNAFLLKIFDLSSSQRVPTTPESLTKLGIADNSVEEGSGKVAVFDDQGVELGAILLGKRREDKPGDVAPGTRAPTTSGQYVRRSGEDQAYLISLPVTLTLGVSNWLDTIVANIREAGVYAVDHNSLVGDQKTTLYSVVRKSDPSLAAWEVPPLVLEEAPAADEEPQESTLSQVRSGLENVRLTDVMSADSAEAKALIFDRQSVYRLTNGLVYTISTVEQKEKVFGTVSVALDASLASTLQAEHDARLKAYEAAKAAQDAAKKLAQEKKAAEPVAEVEAEDASSPEPTPNETLVESDVAVDLETVLVKPEFTLANEAEAETQQSRYRPWVYEFVAYQGKKYRYDRSDLLKKKDAAAESDESEIDSGSEIFEEQLPIVPEELPSSEAEVAPEA